MNETTFSCANIVTIFLGALDPDLVLLTVICQLMRLGLYDPRRKINGANGTLQYKALVAFEKAYPIFI